MQHSKELQPIIIQVPSPSTLPASSSHLHVISKSCPRRSLSLFIVHTEATLVSYDISPTGCIDTICKDNRAACMKVSAETVRHFARLAAEAHAPRYLRFLRSITLPMGKAIPRNQFVAVSQSWNLWS